MAKKETATNVNNNTNIVNVHIPKRTRTSPKKEKKPHWLLKAVIIGMISLIVSLILLYVEESSSANGKPAYIQGGAPAIDSK